jgi:predicted short-subunit dehydrogenase-like oxidoreductase (DUF2520 family)
VRGNTIDFSRTLICITAVHASDSELIRSLAEKLSQNVRTITDEQRMILHLCAVWVNNFTTHMMDIAGTLLREHQMDFSVMLPMVEEMMENFNTADPSLLQTGPAKRGDRTTMQRHLQILESHPVWKDLYEKISNSIMHKFTMP